MFVSEGGVGSEKRQNKSLKVLNPFLQGTINGLKGVSPSKYN